MAGDRTRRTHGKTWREGPTQNLETHGRPPAAGRERSAEARPDPKIGHRWGLGAREVGTLEKEAVRESVAGSRGQAGQSRDRPPLDGALHGGGQRAAVRLEISRCQPCDDRSRHRGPARCRGAGAHAPAVVEIFGLEVEPPWTRSCVNGRGQDIDAGGMNVHAPAVVGERGAHVCLIAGSDGHRGVDPSGSEAAGVSTLIPCRDDNCDPVPDHVRDGVINQRRRRFRTEAQVHDGWDTAATVWKTGVFPIIDNPREPFQQIEGPETVLATVVCLCRYEADSWCDTSHLPGDRPSDMRPVTVAVEPLESSLYRVGRVIPHLSAREIELRITAQRIDS